MIAHGRATCKRTKSQTHALGLTSRSAQLGDLTFKEEETSFISSLVFLAPFHCGVRKQGTAPTIQCRAFNCNESLEVDKSGHC